MFFFTPNNVESIAKDKPDPQTDVAVAVAHGTYIYIEKSGDYAFQRHSYSVHKGRQLIKPMMLVATDGY